MFKFSLKTAALAAATGFAAMPALAAVDCNTFTSMATAYNSCVGLTGGNTSLAGANAAFAGDSTYLVEYKDDTPGFGSTTTAFDLVDSDGDEFTINFFQDFGGVGETVVIGLKFGGQGDDQLGYFLFNQDQFFAAGTSLTFSWSPSFQGDGISHASVYGGSNTPVPGIPEPETYALMLAGLGIVGFMARRRRAN